LPGSGTAPLPAKRSHGAAEASDGLPAPQGTRAPRCVPTPAALRAVIDLERRGAAVVASILDVIRARSPPIGPCRVKWPSSPAMPRALAVPLGSGPYQSTSPAT
jgi:hypothetical protein